MGPDVGCVCGPSFHHAPLTLLVGPVRLEVPHGSRTERERRDGSVRDERDPRTFTMEACGS